VTFTGNTATGAGGAFYARADTGTIDTNLSNCFASGNMARGGGGGVVAVDVIGGTTQSLTIEDCSFTANRAMMDRGGAVRVGSADGAFTMAVRNTIAWHDMAKRGLGADDISLATGVTVANCTLAFSNVGQLDGTCGNGGGNVSPAVDPQFVSARGPNLHLKPTSPMRGLGNCALGPSDDIDGQSRPQGPGCDIGADEIP
jgi:predicted outer membrane repeat protein